MTTVQAIKLLLFMSCREAAPLISQAMDRKLETPARAAVGMHMVICSSCRRYRGQLSLLRRVLAMMGQAPVQLSTELLAPEARLRIQARLEKTGS